MKLQIRHLERFWSNTDLQKSISKIGRFLHADLDSIFTKDGTRLRKHNTVDAAILRLKGMENHCRALRTCLQMHKPVEDQADE